MNIQYNSVFMKVEKMLIKYSIINSVFQYMVLY